MRRLLILRNTRSLWKRDIFKPERGNHPLPRNQPEPTLRKKDQWEVDWRKPDAHTNDHKFVDRSYRHSRFPSEIVSRQQSSWTIILRIRSRASFAGQHTRGNASCCHTAQIYNQTACFLVLVTFWFPHSPREIGVRSDIAEVFHREFTHQSRRARFRERNIVDDKSGRTKNFRRLWRWIYLKLTEVIKTLLSNFFILRFVEFLDFVLANLALIRYVLSMFLIDHRSIIHFLMLL